MKIKKILVWILCGSANFVLTACYGGPVRVRQEKCTIKINNDTIKGLDYNAFSDYDRTVQ